MRVVQSNTRASASTLKEAIAPMTALESFSPTANMAWQTTCRMIMMRASSYIIKLNLNRYGYKKGTIFHYKRKVYCRY